MTPPGADAAALRSPLGSLLDPLPIPFPPRSTGHDITWTPPGSKSLTNRALLLSSLAPGTSILRGALLDAEDALLMRGALECLGARITRSPTGDLSIQVAAGRLHPTPGLELHLGNAGTAVRFLAAACVLADAPVVIDGSERMRQRPIGELALALERLGARVDWLATPGRPPLRITPPPSPRAATILEFRDPASSQFISALLLIAPWVDGGLTLRIAGEVTSSPYIAMTIALLKQAGASVSASPDLREIAIAPGGARALDYRVEPDATGASYAWAAGAILTDRAVTTPGLGSASLQGDCAFTAILRRMGAAVTASPTSTTVRAGSGPLRGIDADLSGMPDTAMTLAVLAALADGPTVVRGLRTLRVKETDRIEAIRAELAKLDAKVTTSYRGDPGAIRIDPPLPPSVPVRSQVNPVVFDTYQDHRMAMSLALVGLARPGVWIRDPGCVAKTYPAFFGDLARVYEG